MVIKRMQLVKCIWKCFPYGKNIKQRKGGDDTQPRTLQPEFPVFYQESWSVVRVFGDQYFTCYPAAGTNPKSFPRSRIQLPTC